MMSPSIADRKGLLRTAKAIAGRKGLNINFPRSLLLGEG